MMKQNEQKKKLYKGEDQYDYAKVLGVIILIFSPPMIIDSIL